MPKIDPRNAPGTIVQSVADKVLGKCTAMAQLDNTNYYLTFLQGVVVFSSDGMEGGAKCAQWMLNVNFSIINQEGAKIELNNIDIFEMHFVHGQILAGKNPTYGSTSRRQDVIAIVIPGRGSQEDQNVVVQEGRQPLTCHQA
jgi:hypothetical protein